MYLEVTRTPPCVIQIRPRDSSSRGRAIAEHHLQMAYAETMLNGKRRKKIIVTCNRATNLRLAVICESHFP